MYKAFIEPDLRTAQLKVYNNFNPFSGFICNPIYILKSKKELPIREILSVLDNVCRIQFLQRPSAESTVSVG